MTISRPTSTMWQGVTFYMGDVAGGLRTARGGLRATPLLARSAEGPGCRARLRLSWLQSPESTGRLHCFEVVHVGIRCRRFVALTHFGWTCLSLRKCVCVIAVCHTVLNVLRIQTARQRGDK